MKKFLAAMAAGGAAFALSAGAAFAASVVSNGSFETGTNPGTFLTVNAGDSTTISNWTVNSGTVDYIGSYWQAADGSRSIDMSGNDAGSISQTFATEVGRTYDVTFDLSGNPAGAPSVKQLQVTATGGAPAAYTYDTAAEANTLANMKWQSESYSFKATSNSTTLTFTSNTNTAYGPALDNVAVVPACVSTPDGTAAIVAASGDTITGTIDATGCDIGVFAGSGVSNVTINATIHDANQEGVMVDNATNVNVSTSTIYNIGNHTGGVFDPNGVQNGQGVRFQNNATGSVTGSNVYAYEKNGIAITHGSSATVSGNAVTGLGPVSFIAANGIEIYADATGSIINNVVKNNYCTYNNPGDNCTGNPTTDPHSDGAAGILIYGPSNANITVSGNTLTGNQFSIWSVGSNSLTVTNNTITGTGGATDTGVAIANADQWHLVPALGTNGTVKFNTIHNVQYGVLLLDYGMTGSNEPALVVNRNNLANDSTDGIWTNTSKTIDGKCNWWGSATGPGPVGPGTGSDVSTNVAYSHWLTSANLNGACNGGTSTITVTNNNTGSVTTTTSSNSSTGGNVGMSDDSTNGGNVRNGRNSGNGGTNDGVTIVTGGSRSNAGSVTIANVNVNHMIHHR